MAVKKNTKWSIPVPCTLDEALELAVKKDTHSSKSEFIRDTVRRKLEEMGYRPKLFEEAKVVE